MAQLTQTAVQSNASGFNDVITLANSGGTENAKLCRAWGNWNGQGVIALRASFNVDTIGDGGAGLYTVNFTTALSSANYSVIYGAQPPTGTNVLTGGPGGLVNFNTIDFRASFQTQAGSNVDGPIITCMVFD